MEEGEVVDSGVVVARTQQFLARVGLKPPPAEVLKRPPFRFLHGVVIALHARTGYPSTGLFPPAALRPLPPPSTAAAASSSSGASSCSSSSSSTSSANNNVQQQQQHPLLASKSERLTFLRRLVCFVNVSVALEGLSSASGSSSSAASSSSSAADATAAAAAAAPAASLPVLAEDLLAGRETTRTNLFLQTLALLAYLHISKKRYNVYVFRVRFLLHFL